MPPTILLHIGPEDNIKLLPVLKGLLGGKYRVRITNEPLDNYLELVVRGKKEGINHVATTSEKVLRSLVNAKTDVSISNYAGSLFKKMSSDILILPPLDWLVTVRHGKFLYERFLSKFFRPSDWMQLPEFTWELFVPKNAEDLLALSESCTFIAADIETIRDDPERRISCIGFSFVTIGRDCYHSNGVSIRTVVIPFDDYFNVIFARRILACKTAKVFQNGKYDIAYLLRYNSPPANYAFDTINMFHSWYCELPKDLGFIPLFLLREWIYHKNEASTGVLLDYYRYNAKDCFVTAMSFLTLVRDMPEYGWKNYLLEFPTVIPCVLAETTGIRIDREAMAMLSNKLETRFTERREKLRRMVANPKFNPNSSVQVVKLFEMLGSGDIKSSGKIPMAKVASRNPFNKRILTDIRTYREEYKMESTYTQVDKIWHDRAYYALNPHGTDTCRLASKESHFWCGWQIQNVPNDKGDISFKSAFIADPGFLFGEADGEQAEARTTAYTSGDTALIAAVEDKSKDYHSLNASKFFGLAYEDISISTYDDILGWVHKIVNKAIRDLSKRTNHGANYNMGESVLLDTMGIENVLRAKRLLNLPAHYTLLDVTKYLLMVFDKTYPVVRNAAYEKIIDDVMSTGYLVSATGWTRRCFGNPKKNKLDLNSYVAHVPQHLNASILNKGWLRVYREVWLPNKSDFKFLAQIHDSIAFLYREGREDLAWQVKSCMEITIPVKDIFGITRDLLVPVALKGGAKRWSDIQPLRLPKKAA